MKTEKQTFHSVNLINEMMSDVELHLLNNDADAAGVFAHITASGGHHSLDDGSCDFAGLHTSLWLIDSSTWGLFVLL